MWYRRHILTYCCWCLVSCGAYAQQREDVERTAFEALAGDNAEDTKTKSRITDVFASADNKFASVMYSKKDLGGLAKALRAYERGAKQPGGVEALEGVSGSLLSLEEKETVAYPDFWLGSIFYQGRNNWQLWVNGEKITPDKPNEALTVLSVSNDHAHFEWKPASDSDIRLLLEQSEQDQKLADLEHRLAKSPIAIDKEAGTVRFYLYPNQRFSVANLAILEGRVEELPVVQVQPPEVVQSEDGDPAIVSDIVGAITDAVSPARAASLEQSTLDELLQQHNNIQSITNNNAK